MGPTRGMLPPMRPLPLVCSLVALTSLACALGNKKDGGGKDGIAQDPACAMYLDCLTATDPTTVGLALETYGEDGSCWETETSADACAAACAEAVTAAHQLYPDEAACDDGSELNTLTLLGASAEWRFTLENLDPDCPYEIGVLDLDGSLQGSDSAAFTLAAEVHLYSLYGGEVDHDEDFTCAVDLADFSCDPAVVEEVDTTDHHYEQIVELSGTFGSTYETADLVAYARFEVDGELDCEATSTFSGEKQ